MHLAYTKDLNLRPGSEDLVEDTHPVAGVLARAAAMADPVEPLEVAQLDLELQRCAARAAPQGHQEPGVETIAARSLDLAMDAVDRALAIDRQDVVRKASKIHRGAPSKRLT